MIAYSSCDLFVIEVRFNFFCFKLMFLFTNFTAKIRPVVQISGGHSAWIICQGQQKIPHIKWEQWKKQLKNIRNVCLAFLNCRLVPFTVCCLNCTDAVSSASKKDDSSSRWVSGVGMEMWPIRGRRLKLTVNSTLRKKDAYCHFSNFVYCLVFFHKLYAMLLISEGPQKPVHSKRANIANTLHQCWHGCGFPCHPQVPYIGPPSPNMLYPLCICRETAINYSCWAAEQPDLTVAQQGHLSGRGWSALSGKLGITVL